MSVTEENDEPKNLGARMVEAEKKMRAPWPAEASMFSDKVGVASVTTTDREPTLSERLDQIEALLEQLLRRVG